MNIKIKKDTIFVFDLDRTIWDCYDKYNNPIWAKQIIFPIISIDDNTIVDDCGSICKLQPGFINFLNKIKNHKIVFLSNGGIFNLSLEDQPSIKLLKHFNIYNFFNFKSILTYKCWPKKNYFYDIYDYIFFDDDDIHLNDLKEKNNVLCIDRKKMEEWKNIQIRY